MFFKKHHLWKASSQQFLMKYLHCKAHLRSLHHEIYCAAGERLFTSSALYCCFSVWDISAEKY